MKAAGCTWTMNGEQNSSDTFFVTTKSRSFTCRDDTVILRNKVLYKQVPFSQQRETQRISIYQWLHQYSWKDENYALNKRKAEQTLKKDSRSACILTFSLGDFLCSTFISPQRILIPSGLGTQSLWPSEAGVLIFFHLLRCWWPDDFWDKGSFLHNRSIFPPNKNDVIIIQTAVDSSRNDFRKIAR